MKILSIGCSHTFGADLPDTDRGVALSDPKNASKFAWPSLLVKKYQSELKNLSACGASNSRTFRIAMSESLKNNYDIVFCQWTEFSRLDLQLDGVDLPVNFAPSTFNMYPWLSDFAKYHLNDDHSYQTWLCQLITLQNHFKLVNQKYIFISMNSPRYNDSLTSKYQHLVDSVDKKYFIGWDTNHGILQWAADNLTEFGHPTTSGQQIITDIIDENIRNFGWVS